jgi:hypothetical protein
LDLLLVSDPVSARGWDRASASASASDRELALALALGWVLAAWTPAAYER